MQPVDYFKRETPIQAVNEIKKDVYGFIFMEIFFELEDSLDFDYDQFEKKVIKLIYFLLIY